MPSFQQESKREKKRTVNDYLSLDVRKIRPIFRVPDTRIEAVWTVTSPCSTQTFTSMLSLSGKKLFVTHPFDGDDIGVPILSRRAYFGGWRKFFQCPWCSRVCELIYFGPDEYGCRVCLDLTYISVQQAHRYDRLFRILYPDLPLSLVKKIYRGLRKGTAQIKNEYSQPWSGGQKSAWDRSIDIVVK